MNKKDTIITLGLIALLSYSCYKLGQGNPIVIEKTVEVKVYDKGFCVSCYKEHNWSEMYVLTNEFLEINDSIHNTNEAR
jgi:hypothetical protein